MLLAATPIPDAEWIPPVLVLIFAVPIGAFLSLYATITSFLFHSVREGMPVMVLGFVAFAVNGCAVLVLIGSAYSSGRFLVVPLVAWVVAVGAAGVMGYRVFPMVRAQDQLRRARMDEAMSRYEDDF